MVPVDMEDGTGRIRDGLQVGAEGADDRRSDPVAQMDDERGRRVERRDLTEKPLKRPVAVGDRVPDDDESQVPSGVPRPDGPRGLAVRGDESPHLERDRNESGILAEPGHVVSAVLDAVPATPRQEDEGQRGQQDSSSGYALSHLSYPL